MSELHHAPASLTRHVKQAVSPFREMACFYSISLVPSRHDITLVCISRSEWIRRNQRFGFRLDTLVQFQLVDDRLCNIFWLDGLGLIVFHSELRLCTAQLQINSILCLNCTVQAYSSEPCWSMYICSDAIFPFVSWLLFRKINDYEIFLQPNYNRDACQYD